MDAAVPSVHRHGVITAAMSPDPENTTSVSSSSPAAAPLSSTYALMRDENDVVFVAKLVALSFAGGALIKYGSLTNPVAFSADPTLAACLVLGPPLAYGIMLLRRGSGH